MKTIEQVYDPEIPMEVLEEHPENPRRGDDKVVAESIKRSGFFGAILVQKSTNRIIAGNTRFRVLREEGEKSVPGFWVDCDDAEARRILLVDNRSSDLAFYEDQQLFSLLRDILESDGLEGTGYDRASYELLLQSIEADEIVGGVRQGVVPADRIDAYNEMGVHSLVLPYAIERYEKVAAAFSTLRTVLGLDTNADVAERLVTEAMEKYVAKQDA